MGCSYKAQIFPLRKLTALAHTIHTNIHTYIHIIYARNKQGPLSILPYTLRLLPGISSLLLSTFPVL